MKAQDKTGPAQISFVYEYAGLQHAELNDQNILSARYRPKGEVDCSHNPSPQCGMNVEPLTVSRKIPQAALAKLQTQLLQSKFLDLGGDSSGAHEGERSYDITLTVHINDKSKTYTFHSNPSYQKPKELQAAEQAINEAVSSTFHNCSW
jgi:hypothetical protein